eukprot:s359_g29.t1
MAHLKKLQTEMDKGLKKVDEGVEEYNRLKEAHHRASQPNQREKLEESLKAQIKKLQRDRNQLSAWIADKSVKEKDHLMESKSKIEALMDHFKDFERESKTKRFSQVGLNKEDRADPEVQKRREMITWIQDMLSNLEKEFDELTAEDQRLTSRKPSKNSKEEANLAFTKRVLESHRWHRNKLEQLQRKLNNEDVNVESLETLKDSLTNYMDEGINQRTAEGFMDFNEAYDDFNLEEVEDYLATGREKDDEEEKEEVKKEEPKPKEPAKHKSPSISVHPRPVEEKPKEKVASKQIAPRVLAQPPAHHAPSQASHAMPSAVAAAAAPAAPVASPPKPHVPKQPMVAPPPQVPPQRPVHVGTVGPVDAIIAPVPPPSKPPPPDAVPAHAPPPAHPPPPPPNVLPPLPPAQAAFGLALPPVGLPPPPNEAPPVAGAQNQIEVAEGPAGLQYAALTKEQERNHALFEASGRFMPLPSDRRKHRNYSPKIPYIHRDTAGRPLYPEEPSRSSEDPRVFERYTEDTLFFIFYFQQGTYQQYLAANLLNRKTWRYHTKYHTWFQRHEQPICTAPEFESGTFRFFDFETKWEPTVKQDFTFEYAWLESSDL